MDEQIRAIQEYVYSKYVEPSDHGTLDEEGAVRRLDSYYGDPARANDAECFFPGVLWFELGFEHEDDDSKRACFLRAYYWLKKHQILTGEEWDVVDDRILDIEDWAEELGVQLELDPPPPIPEAPETSGEVEPVVEAEPEMAPHVVDEIDDHGPMMLVAPGAFFFGLDKRRVELGAYYIDKYPVTNRQYEAFCRATGYRWPKFKNDERFNDPDAPVVGISVQDAEKYARWVGKSLPTEEQWEKACRGSDGRLYPWGKRSRPTGAPATARTPRPEARSPSSTIPTRPARTA